MTEKILIVLFAFTLFSCSERSSSEAEASRETEAHRLNYKKVDKGYVIYLDSGGMVLISNVKNDEFVSYEIGDRSFLSYSDGRYVVMNTSNDVEVMRNDDLDIEPDFIRKKNSLYEVDLKLSLVEEVPPKKTKN